MSIKIIKRGIPPEKMKFIGECCKCKSIIEWERPDGMMSRFEFGKEESIIHCPVCNFVLLGEEKKT
jgi:hypothetical protein